jgi:HPt (histidine-containing phosphotransfer) domain-containing protein
MSPFTPSQQTSAMLALVWTRNRDLLLHRLDSIDALCRQLPGSAADQELRHQASGDAHKLAGSLGMFGLSAGTTAARELEHRLNDSTPDELLAADIPKLAGNLRALIEAFQVQVEEPLHERRRRLLIVENVPHIAQGIFTAAEKRGIEPRIAADLSV